VKYIQSGRKQTSLSSISSAIIFVQELIKPLTSTVHRDSNHVHSYSKQDCYPLNCGAGWEDINRAMLCHSNKELNQ